MKDQLKDNIKAVLEGIRPQSNSNSGGAAFPQKRLYRDSQGIDHEVMETGMSLRDWFAGQALAGYFAAPNTPHRNATDCAAYIYEMADAMLAARKGGGA